MSSFHCPLLLLLFTRALNSVLSHFTPFLSGLDLVHTSLLSRDLHQLLRGTKFPYLLDEEGETCLAIAKSRYWRITSVATHQPAEAFVRQDGLAAAAEWLFRGLETLLIELRYAETYFYINPLSVSCPALHTLILRSSRPGGCGAFSMGNDVTFPSLRVLSCTNVLLYDAPMHAPKIETYYLKKSSTSLLSGSAERVPSFGSGDRKKGGVGANETLCNLFVHFEFPVPNEYEGGGHAVDVRNCPSLRTLHVKTKSPVEIYGLAELQNLSCLKISNNKLRIGRGDGGGGGKRVGAFSSFAALSSSLQNPENFVSISLQDKRKRESSFVRFQPKEEGEGEENEEEVIQEKQLEWLSKCTQLKRLTIDSAHLWKKKKKNQSARRWHNTDGCELLLPPTLTQLKCINFLANFSLLHNCCPNLTNLCLSGVKLQWGEEWEGFSDICSKLVRFEVGETFKIPCFYEPFPNLVELVLHASVQGCSLEGAIDSPCGMEFLFPKLQKLTIKKPERLENLNGLDRFSKTPLRHLCLLDCLALGNISNLIDCPRLEILELVNLRHLFGENVEKAVQGCKRLRRIRVFGCPKIEKRHLFTTFSCSSCSSSSFSQCAPEVDISTPAREYEWYKNYNLYTDCFNEEEEEEKNESSNKE